MTLETFFKKFELFADAPDAVARMRKLVLTLAVQGKLLEQNPGDQPASVLIEEIEAGRAKVGTDRKVKKSNLVLYQTFTKENEPYQPPAGWIWVKLGFLAEIERGGSPRPIKDYITDDPEGLNWIKIGDTKKGGRYITSTQERIRKEGLKKTRKVFPGDFLLTNSMSFGRPYISKIEGCIHDGWLRIHPPRQITPEYLYHLLSSSFVFALFCKSAAGAVVQNLNADKVRELPIPLPPLAEQKRIVAKVDELMALCDRLEAQQQERNTLHADLARASLARFAEAPTPANLNLLFHKSYTIPPADLRKSILTLAVQGKLVARYLKEGTAKSILKEAGASSLVPENAPEIPPHWAWATLGSLASMMSSGWSPACNPEPSEPNQWGVLKTTAVQPLEYREFENKLLPSKLEPRPAAEVNEGDILFTRAGPMNRVGILCVARPTRPKLMISDKIIRFHLTKSIDPDYAVLSLISGYSNQFIETLKSGMAASQVNVSQPKLKSVPMPLPPLAEQRRIVARVDQLMALVDQLETQLTTSCATAKNLLEALVAELTTS